MKSNLRRWLTEAQHLQLSELLRQISTLANSEELSQAIWLTYAVEKAETKGLQAMRASIERFRKTMHHAALREHGESSETFQSLDGKARGYLDGGEG